MRAETEKKRKDLERKWKQADARLGAWRNAQLEAGKEERLLQAEIARENLRVKSLNQMRCKRM